MFCSVLIVYVLFMLYTYVRRINNSVNKLIQNFFVCYVCVRENSFQEHVLLWLYLCLPFFLIHKHLILEMLPLHVCF